MKSITYYASDRTKYFKGRAEVIKYYAKTAHETVQEIGDISALMKLGKYFSKHYFDNKGNVKFKNCEDALGCDKIEKRSLKDQGFRPFTSDEEAIFQAAVKRDGSTLERLLDKRIV
ncbi:MAG: hypothetical protein ACP5OA_06700 [Candidatus Woesearchaeota archaeon]